MRGYPARKSPRPKSGMSSRFSIEKQNAKGLFIAVGAESILRPSPLLGGGLGEGRIVNAGVPRKKKSPTEIRDVFPFFGRKTKRKGSFYSSRSRIYSATKSPPRRGFGGGWNCKCGGTPQEKVPNRNQGLNFISSQQPLLERNYILHAVLLIMRMQLIVAVGEDKQLVAHLQLGISLRYEVVAIATYHHNKRVVG